MQEFHGMYVLVPEDKAANTLVSSVGYTILGTYGTKAFEETSTDEKSVVISHSNDLPHKFVVNVK